MQLQVNWIGAQMQVESSRLKAKMDQLLNVIHSRTCTCRKRGSPGGTVSCWSGVRSRAAAFVGRTDLCCLFLKLLPGFRSKLRFSFSQELRL